MRRKTVCAALCSAAVLSSLLLSSNVMAREVPKWIAIRQDESDEAWEKLAMTDNDVITGVNIRAQADAESEIVGNIYPGCAVWVIEKGEKWTEISSGDIEGFVDNDYLVYGEEAEKLSGEYAVLGVTAIWDGVCVFGEPNGDSEIWDELKAGDDLKLLEDNGHWLTVEYGKGERAYVSEEDVQKSILLDAAYAPDEEYDGFEEETEEYVEEEYEEYVAPETSAQTYVAPQTEAVQPQTQKQTEAPQTETQKQTEAPQTETQKQTEAPQTQAATEAPTTEASDDGDDEEIDLGEDGWYDADTDTYYDGNGNVISKGSKNDQGTSTISTTAAASTATYSAEALPQETVVSETADPSSVNADDAALLAALIYCEAGNQSYDGMMAVGSVVANRVADPAFPDTVSDVIYESGQFAPVSDGSLASALENGVPSECYDAAVAALSGECPAGDVLYFNSGTGEGEIIDNQQFY